MCKKGSQNLNAFARISKYMAFDEGDNNGNNEFLVNALFCGCSTTIELVKNRWITWESF